MKNFVYGWGDVSVAAVAAVYALVRVLTAEDPNAMEPGQAREITIIFAASLFYIFVRLIWKAIQRYLKKQHLRELDNT